MATRFYPDPTNAPDVSPAYGNFWDDTTQAVRRKLELDTKGNNGSVSRSYTETTTTSPYDALLWQFVSEPLDAHASIGIAASKIAFRCYEDSAKADATLRFTWSKCDGDGSNRDWERSDTEDTEFDDAAYVNRYHTINMSQSLSINQGDRLILEVGVVFQNTKSDAYTGYINVTDNHASTDLPENDTETTAYNSWAETGDTFTVASVSGWTGKVSGVDSTNIAKIMGVAIADIAKVGGV